LFRSFREGSSSISQPIDTYLVANDVKEFGEMAILLTRSFGSGLFSPVWFLKMQLLDWIIKEKGLFDSISHIEKLRRSLSSLIDGYQLDIRQLSLFNLILME
jgi:hypothetical protein